ncbi:hypothetical protein [Streptomyces sp. BE20]|uniref:hypothetical protein n=1 Tax=Streptomyces sp. BE20 TaxID=3002525 RepID=UPI002E7A7331|nr:hypothetical protein [Streptomyces sp. BE20]
MPRSGVRRARAGQRSGSARWASRNCGRWRARCSATSRRRRWCGLCWSAARASLIDTGALPLRHGIREPFRDLAAAMDNALDLTHHRPGTLPRLAGYLHARTGGRIGSLSRLIRQAAITTILDGTERITRTVLENIAEEHYRPRGTPRELLWLSWSP